MKILGEGRQVFLEFLRNLTPQVLLLAVVLPMGVQLDFRVFDASNWVVTLAFFACALTLLLAVLANTMQFMDGYADLALKEIDRKMARARRRLPRLSQRLILLLRLSNRSKWKLIFHFSLIFVIAQGGVLAAATIGIRQAIQLWK